MAGEISPDMMFREGVQKMAYMGADGYREVLVGADGCRGKGEATNKQKKAPNGREEDVLCSMHTVQKCNMLMKMGFTRREGQVDK